MTTNYGEGIGPAHLRRRRPHRPRHPAHAVSADACSIDAEFFIEYFALDLIMDDEGACRGVVALEPRRRHACTASAPSTWCSRPAATAAPTSPAPRPHTCTGDGNGMVLRAGLPLQDMEFVQFHPTGIYGAGCLITEGARGEGGYLDQLARASASWSAMRRRPRTWPSRDVVSRADDHRDPRRPRRAARTRTTSTCTSSISTRRSCTSACPASPKARASSPAST
jgi:succinate dehydrogenase / fumarate reductase flavoprotein subunit